MEKQTPKSERAVETNIAEVFRFSGETMRMAIYPIELWLQWQADMLKAAAPAAADWIARRQEGTDAALRALERLMACESLDDASKAQRDWVEGEMKRLEMDVRAFSGQAFMLAQETAKAPQRAVQAGRETGARARPEIARESA